MELDDKITSARILVVDDNPVNVSLLEGILDEAGYENVITTTDPTEVVDLYLGEDVDLVLLDIRMPVMDGFEVMEALGEKVPDDYIPVLVLTAQIDLETRHRALELGAKDFVTKPFEQTEVLHRIRNMLEVRLLYKERRAQNEILEQRVRERTAELEDTRLEIIRRLGRAAEYRDNETGLHVIRMSKFSHALALAAGLSAREAEEILHAAPMHDVGKIGISDSVLLKPGQLDADEWDLMKTHPTIGAEILSDGDSPLLELARTVALTHHEKWDGSGYPRGLKGKEIPLEARIVAICDVFDALTSDRPYKKAWSIEAASTLIREQAGRHFDPRLAGLFLGILPEILKIRECYLDEG